MYKLGFREAWIERMMSCVSTPSFRSTIHLIFLVWMATIAGLLLRFQIIQTKVEIEKLKNREEIGNEKEQRRIRNSVTQQRWLS